MTLEPPPAIRGRAIRSVSMDLGSDSGIVAFAVFGLFIVCVLVGRSTGVFLRDVVLGSTRSCSELPTKELDDTKERRRVRSRRDSPDSKVQKAIVESRPRSTSQTSQSDDGQSGPRSTSTSGSERSTTKAARYRSGGAGGYRTNVQEVQEDKRRRLRKLGLKPLTKIVVSHT
jgi:hypothetical protein